MRKCDIDVSGRHNVWQDTQRWYHNAGWWLWWQQCTMTYNNVRHCMTT